MPATSGGTSAESVGEGDESLLQFEYWAGNPSINLTNGVFYCSESVPCAEYGTIPIDGAPDAPRTPRTGNKQAPPDPDRLALLCTNVPTSMSPSEFCWDFLDWRDLRRVPHMRVFHGPRPREYLILLILREGYEALGGECSGTLSSVSVPILLSLWPEVMGEFLACNEEDQKSGKSCGIILYLGNFGFLAEGQNVVNRIRRISWTPKNAHFLSINPQAADTQLAAQNGHPHTT